MICEDCIFEMGLTDYEFHSPARHNSYICKRCDERVPARKGYDIEERIHILISEKEDLSKNNLPISFIKLRNNCKHYLKEDDFRLCFHGMTKKRKKEFYPDICRKEDCPILKVM